MARMLEHAQKSTDKTANARHNEFEEVLSVKEAGEYLKVSHNTISNLIISKKLDSFKIGSRRLIRKSAIDKFINQAEEEEKYEG